MQIVRFIEQHKNLQDAWFTPTWGILEAGQVFPLAHAPYLGIQVKGAARSLENVQLVAPATPSKLVCVGRNYAEHAAELGNEVPPEPLIFLKPPSTVVGPDAPVVYPAISQRVEGLGPADQLVNRAWPHLGEEVVGDEGADH